MSLISALQADAFVDAVGVNVHSSYGVADPTNAYAGNWAPLVGSMNVRHVRDNIATSGAGAAAGLAAASALQSDGVDALYIVDGPTPLTELLASSLPEPLAVEPWNEWDNSGGGGWAAAIQSFQPTLYSQIKSQWSNCTVLGASLMTHSNNTVLGSLLPDIDANNLHVYQPPAQEPEYAPLMASSQSSLYTTQGPGKPLWITETGLVHGSLADPATLTSELSAARLLPRTLMYLWAPTGLTTVTGSPWPSGTGGLGAERIYLYELLDEHDPVAYSPITEDRFGLFRHDLTPKLAATCLGNLLSLLSDPGMTFAPDTLDISVTGGNAPFSYILFQKRDGTFWIAYWMGEPTVNDGLVTHSPDRADVYTNVTLWFNRTLRSVQYYRPMSGVQAVQHAGSCNSVTVKARLDIQLLQLRGTTEPHKRPSALRSYYDSRPDSLG